MLLYYNHTYIFVERICHTYIRRVWGCPTDSELLVEFPRLRTVLYPALPLGRFQTRCLAARREPTFRNRFTRRERKNESLRTPSVSGKTVGQNKARMNWNKFKKRLTRGSHNNEIHKGRIHTIDWDRIYEAIDKHDVDQVCVILRNQTLSRPRKDVLNTLSKGDPNAGSSFVLHELLRRLSYSNSGMIFMSVQELLRRGYDPTVQDKNGQTAIHILVQSEGTCHDCLKLIDILMQFVGQSTRRRPYVDTMDEFGESAIFYATHLHSAPGIICKLLDYSADPFLGDPTRTILLHRLLCKDYPLYRDESSRAVKRLLELGADPKMSDGSGKTSLHILARNHGGVTFNRFVDILLSFVDESEKGDYINAMDGEGKSAIFYAANTSQGGVTKVLRLLDLSADPFVGDPTGSSILYGLLHNIGWCGNMRGTRDREVYWLRATQRLLKLGADPKVLDKGGQTALHILAKKGWLLKFCEFITLLIQYVDEAEIVQYVNSIDVQGKSAIFYAVDSFAGSSKIQHLLDFSVNPNVQDKNGQTILHILAMKDSLWPKLEIVDTLLRHGADPTIEDYQGNSPLTYLGDSKAFDPTCAFLLLTHIVGRGYQ